MNAHQAEAARRNLAEGGRFLFLFVHVTFWLWLRDIEEMMKFGKPLGSEQRQSFENRCFLCLS